MNYENFKKPSIIAGLVAILFVLLFLPIAQGIILAFEEEMIINFLPIKPEKMIIFITLCAAGIIFISIFTIYWFKFTPKNILLLLSFASIVATIFFILYKASWTFGDDHEFLTSTAVGMPHPFYSMGRRFYGHLEYNFLIFTPFYANPFAYYIVNVIYYLISVFFIVKILIFIDSKINPQKNKLFYALYFFVCFYFNTKSALFFYGVVFTEKIVILSFAIITYLLLKGSENNNFKLYFIALIIGIIATYFKEPVFASLFTIAFSMLIIYNKKLTKGQVFFIIGILLNTIIFLTLYYFLSYINSSASYSSGREMDRLVLFFKMFKKTPYAGLIFTLAIYRITIYFMALRDKKQVLDIMDALLFGGLAYIVIYFILGMISHYYLLPAIILAMPAFFRTLFQILSCNKKYITNIILSVCIIVFLVNVKDFVRTSTKTTYDRIFFPVVIEKLYSICQNKKNIYWYIEPEQQEIAVDWSIVIIRIAINFYNNYKIKIDKINKLPQDINKDEVIIASSKIQQYENSNIFNKSYGKWFYYYWK